MSGLFEPWKIKGIEFRNRLVRSATNMRLAGPRGEVTEELLQVHRRLAEGGVGLSITGHAFVAPQGKVNPGQLGIWDDGLIEGLKELVGVAHRGGARIFVQLSHGGPLAFCSPQERVSPSPFKGAREMTLEEIQGMIKAFIEAAKRAREAGFDGVQLHAAHGYLLSSFLSPKINKRKDSYGGRAGGIRLLGEIIRRIKAEVGPDFPVLVKMGPDNPPGGNGPEELLEILKALVREGLDGVELSRGIAPQQDIIREGVRPFKNEAYNLPWALKVKGNFPELPVILVGGIRSLEWAEDILRQGIDAIALSRPLIREPELPSRWMKGDRSPSRCISCNLCFTIKDPVRCRARDR